RGAFIEVGLSLVGAAVNHLPIFLAALRLLFRNEGLRRHCAARLVGVSTAGPGDDRLPILDAAGNIQPPQLRILSFAELTARWVVPADAVTLEFLTPLRIIRE